MSESFIRKKENFVCEKCKHSVVGNGYTNHCTKCLWSKHVDIHPGDRAEKCCGLMEPVALEHEKGEQVLVHTCVLCGHQKRNKTVPEDDFEALLSLSKKIAET